MLKKKKKKEQVQRREEAALEAGMGGNQLLFNQLSYISRSGRLTSHRNISPNLGVKKIKQCRGSLPPTEFFHLKIQYLTKTSRLN